MSCELFDLCSRLVARTLTFSSSLLLSLMDVRGWALTVGEEKDPDSLSVAAGSNARH